MTIVVSTVKTGGIATYPQLLIELTRLIDGDDVSATTIAVETLRQIINLGERRLYREVRSAQNEKAWGLTVTGNAVTLPVDFQAASIAHFGRLPLEPVAEEVILDRGRFSQGGDCLYYAKAGNTLVFSPSVADGTALQGRYYCSLPSLDATTLPGNLLFAQAEDLFIYAALTESAPFFEQDNRIQLWNAKYLDILKQVNENHHRGAYSAGRIKIRPSTRLMR